MSVKPTTKDQYGSPLGSNKGSTVIRQLAPTTPLLAPKVRQQGIKPTMVNIIKTAPSNSTQLPQNPLVNYSNDFTPLQYHNTLVTPRDFTQTTQLPQNDNIYIENKMT